MTKFMDGLYKYFIWIIMALSMIAYFAYMVLDFDGDIERTIEDWRTWIHVAFVVYLNVMMLSGALDSGVSVGISSEEFELADKLNNQIITSVNNEMEDFRKYVKKLNEHELQTLRDDYLFKVGDKKVEELTKKELKKYKKLKPLRHDIYGFNLPLYYEISKNGQVKYQASIKKNQGKLWKIIKKIFNGILFAGMTINVAFSIDNVGAAFTSLLIISSGLFLTFIMTFFPQVYKFRKELPKKVILKKTLYNSFIEYKNGTHKLRALEITENLIDQKQPVVNAKNDDAHKTLVKKDEQPIDKSNEDNLLTEGLTPVAMQQ